ncbi:MAG: fibronectin type III domain-containing protein [Leptospiraceae bacterium]|nr:fibronectin type III domain-containing protein [Leptospiraceae bacterium]
MARINGIILIGTLALTACVGRGSDEDNSNLALLAALGNTNISSEPSVQYPSRAPAGLFSTEVSSIQAPSIINGTYRPIGLVYDIGVTDDGIEAIQQNAESEGSEATLDAEDHISFGPDEPVRMEYEYDAALLAESGLLEEFGVFFYDTERNRWLPVDDLEVDMENDRVVAYTSHLTPFVLAAVVSVPSSVVAPPACLADDFPAGINGNGSADFMTVGSNFRYYQDRDYYVVPNQDFQDLGFQGALGISTCNGGSACGSFGQHKQFTGQQYIEFTAHTDLDVYIMYDTRGGVDRNDTSRDASWIAAAGFTNTGRFIETTDAVQYYTVYKKTYNAGQLVSLDGNRRGATDGAINTNYWVVLKPAGVTTEEPAHDLCVANPPVNPPLPVINLQGMSGVNSIQLRWVNPAHADFDGVVIRRSTVQPPISVYDGQAPTGTEVNPTSYRDESLTPNTLYYYTVFALYGSSSYYPTASIAVQTGTNDQDGDGLADDFEDTIVYYTGLKSDKNNSDTDGDGTPDGIEWSNGTDPTNRDTIKPVLTSVNLYNLTPEGKTRTRSITLGGWVNANDYARNSTQNRFGTMETWALVTDSSSSPHPSDPRWTRIQFKSAFWSIEGEVRYMYYTLPPSAGTHTFYVYLKDRAGNVSNPYEKQLELVENSAAIIDHFGVTNHIPDRNFVNAVHNGQQYQLLARLIDYEYGQCDDMTEADRANGFTWTLVNKPAASSISFPDFGASSSAVSGGGGGTRSYTITGGAYFTPDVTGEYEFRMEYTDKVPANCVGNTTTIAQNIIVNSVVLKGTTDADVQVDLHYTGWPFADVSHSDGMLSVPTPAPPWPDNAYGVAEQLAVNGAYYHEYGRVTLFGCLGLSLAQCFPMTNQSGERHDAYLRSIQAIAPWAYAFMTYEPFYRLYHFRFYEYGY